MVHEEGSAAVRYLQNQYLYGLLLIQAKNQKAGIKVKGLTNLLSQVKAGMTDDNISWVEYQVAQVDKDEL